MLLQVKYQTSKIIKSTEIPIEEKVYLKKDLLGWRVVEPIKDPETNKINYFSLLFGGKRGLVFLVILLILAGALYIGIKENISAYKQIADNPCDYCEQCFPKGNTGNSLIIPNFSIGGENDGNG